MCTNAIQRYIELCNEAPLVPASAGKRSPSPPDLTARKEAAERQLV
jgi:hypothetical protein